jgi:hypothetical protein
MACNRVLKYRRVSKIIAMFINVVAEPRLIEVRTAFVSKSVWFLTNIDYTAIKVPYHT